MTISEIANKKGVIIIIGHPADLSAAYAEAIEFMEICGPFQILQDTYPEKRRDPFDDLIESFEKMTLEMDFCVESIAKAMDNYEGYLGNETQRLHHSQVKQRFAPIHIARKPPYNRRGHRQSYKPPPEQKKLK